MMIKKRMRKHWKNNKVNKKLSLKILTPILKQNSAIYHKILWRQSVAIREATKRRQLSVIPWPNRTTRWRTMRTRKTMSWKCRTQSILSSTGQSSQQNNHPKQCQRQGVHNLTKTKTSVWSILKSITASHSLTRRSLSSTLDKMARFNESIRTARRK